MLHRISLFLILCTCFLQGCTPENSSPITEANPSLLGQITETGPALTAPTEAVASVFLDAFPVTNISLVELVESKMEKGSYYLYAEGADKSPTAEEGQILIMRFTTEVNDGKVYLDFTKSNVLGESCSGDNCSKCAFKTGGGCKCEKVINALKPAGCNHTITKG